MQIPTGHGHALLTFSGVCAPLGAACTVGFENVPDFSPAVCAGFIVDHWEAYVMPHTSSALTFLGCLVKLGPNETGPSGFNGSAAVGGQAATGVSPAVTYLARKNTLLGGRKGRGRMYIPGPTEGSVSTAGVILEATRANLEAALTSFRSELANDGIILELLHNDSTVPTTITSFTVDSVAATQRRRQRR